jgi:carboxyl-terminal processing protease
VFGRSGRDRKAVEQALDLVEQRALFAEEVTDWPATRASVLAAAEDPDQLELALYQLVRTAGGRHSGVRRAGYVRTAVELPSVEEQGEAVVVTLPACADQHAKEYADAARKALAGQAAARWIVDLRGNGGGSMLGLLGAVAPLLGTGEVGAFVYRDGNRTPWLLPEHERLEGPVSVLTDGHTAGAAEAVVVAFKGIPGVRSYGSPTLGFSMGNESVRLPGDLVLSVSTSRFADRTGTVYGGRIDPDVPSEDPLSMALWDL